MENETNNSNNGEVRAFLLASISDMQSTIRSLDVKANILLALLVLPFSKFGAIRSGISGFLNTLDSCSYCFFIGLIGVLGLLWGAGFIAVIRALIAIDNPSHHVSGNKPAGIFYSGRLY